MNTHKKSDSSRKRTYLPFLLSVAAPAIAAGLMSLSAVAATYYYDNDSSTPGFGTAGGIWAAPTPGPIPGWTTDATGSSIPGSITTTTSDLLNFGSGSFGLGAGTITLSGALTAGNIIYAPGSGAITLSGGTSLTLPAAAVITVSNSSDTISTPLAGATTSLTKAGAGTLILSGANTAAIAFTVNSGELQLNNTAFNDGAKVIILTAATSLNQTAVLNLVNSSFTNSGSDSIGFGTNASGIIKMSSGNFVKTAGNLNFNGSGNTALTTKTNYGAFLMSGGFAAFGGEFDMSREQTTGGTYVNLSGGTLVTSNFATIGREGFGVLDISGGICLRPATAASRFYMARTAGSSAQLTIRGSGTMDYEDNAGFAFANSTAPILSGVVNLMTGGTLISRVGISWNANVSTLGLFNFNGGKLQANGASATFWTNGWTACYVYGGGATIDSQANNITIGQPLLAPVGGGVTSITGGTGSGYLAPPLVSVTGDGTGATAIAQIDGSGNITNILVSNPGVNYSSATVALMGGGGTASGWTANVGANPTTGGLTKLGTGTLTLNGANTYQGATKIGAGALAISYANYPAASALTVSNNAALSTDVSGGASTLETPSLTLGTNTTITLSYGTLGGNPFQPAISDATINAGTVLTANGTNIVINISGSGFDSGQFPLIKYSGTIGGNGFGVFRLGTLPSGVSIAQLVNNTANKTIDLLIPLVNSITWNGSNPNWDINTTVNWKDPAPTTYKQYGTTNIYGDEVTFDDSLSNPAQTNINLTTTLRPSTVNVTGSGTPYVFGGAGKLNGGAFLAVSGSAALVINTTNDYTGGSLLSGGTVIVNNDSALGSGPISLAGSILSSDSATARTFSNNVSITVDSTFGTGPTSGALTFMAPADLGNAARGFTLDNSVAFTGPASNGGIVKGGAGTLTFDNPGTVLTGGTTVFGGKVAFNNGSYAGAINVAPSISQVGVLEIGSANVTNTGVNNIGTGADAIGVIKQSGGNFVTPSAVAFGNTPSGSAAYLMTGGFASFGGDTKFDNLGAVGLVSQSGGTMVSLNFFTLARDGGLGVYDLSGGTHFRPANATNTFYLGTRVSGGNAQLTIRGTGTLDIEDNTGLWFNRAGDRTLQTFGTVNLLTGGTLISRPGIFWGSSNVSSVGYFNFNGGTLRASADTANYLTEWTGAYVYAGGAVIDSQNYSLGISQALLTPTGGGVTSITGGSGSGYLAPPVVNISGDGTGAAAVAQIDSNGNITSILVTSPGIDYTSAAISLNGGGGTGGGYTVNIGANPTTGGVTKIGSGTLTLIGTNNYRGVTTISNGRLVYGKANGATGNIVVSNGAALGCLQDTPGDTVHLSSATAAAGGGLLAQFTGNTGNPTTIAGYITNLTLNGATPVSVLCSGIQVGAIPLFQYSSISGAGSITTGILPQGVVGTITNDTTTKTISLIVTGFAPLIWSGATGNIWDINISTNWILSASPAVYQDGASLVLFNDTAANGTLVITQAVSPASVVFSNSSVAFDVGTSGAGVLSGGTGVTKNGSGTASLSGTNNYTGPTVINAGTLQIGNGGVGGVLANDSDITVGSSATLAFNTTTTQNNILNDIAGTGTITKSGGQMGWGGTNTFSGTINVLSGKLAFSGSETENGQPNLGISSGAVVSIGVGFVGGVATLGNLSGGGAIDAAFGATVGTRTFQVNQTTDGVFSGPIAESSAGRILAVVKTGPASLTLSGTNAFTGGLLASNGTLVVNGPMISNSVVTVNSGATFGGSGSLVGIVSFSAGSSATNIVGAPMTIETLDLAGNATMQVGAAAPVSAGSYPLINYTTQTGAGSFTSFSVGGAGLAPGASASLVNSNNTIILNVVGGSGPTPTNITFTVTGGQLVLNWPAGQGWQLQAQTNALNVGLRTNWVTIGGAVPPLTNAISPATPTVFYRLKY